jgi:hypothetical protein
MEVPNNIMRILQPLNILRFGIPRGEFVFVGLFHWNEIRPVFTYVMALKITFVNYICYHLMWFISPSFAMEDDKLGEAVIVIILSIHMN